LPERSEAKASNAATVIVIPAYRAASTIVGVVYRALEVATMVIVVDDACPEQSGALVAATFSPASVAVVTHERNRGVGGAMKTGFAAARRLGAAFAVKLDADGQMDETFIPHMIDILIANPEIDMVKGNRFAHSATLSKMPIVRLIGNAALTLLVKFSSGYWTIVDPTNGFIAVRIDGLDEEAMTRLSDRYFFEIDFLCMFGVQRRMVAELEMPPIYAGEHSSLSISRVMFSFPGLLLARFLRRLLLNYAVFEINIGSLCALIGFPLLVFALIFGLDQWRESIVSGVPRATGTIILSLLLFMVGFQLSLQAFLYDVQFAIRTRKFRRGTGLIARSGDDVQART
jgi:glycosyltransferase involved in cell wall biosynthesis